MDCTSSVEMRFIAICKVKIMVRNKLTTVVWICLISFLNFICMVQCSSVPWCIHLLYSFGSTDLLTFLWQCGSAPWIYQTVMVDDSAVTLHDSAMTVDHSAGLLRHNEREFRLD